MIALIQRVTKSLVTIDAKVFSGIGHGYTILLGILADDTDEDIKKIIPKIVHLRIMDDENGKMNRSILDTRGEILVVSQFTLCADVTQGRRPSYTQAMKPEEAKKIYNIFVEELKKTGVPVKTGEFGAMMEVEIYNDGPVTILIDSKNL